jgi:ribose/xylose/arabinose/galactoside ABC-type transport system permease subunit
MGDFFDSVVLPILIIAGLIGTLIGAVIGVGYVCTRIDCASFMAATGTPTRMGGFACYVEQDGKVIPMDLYKAAYERNLSIKVKP